MNPKKLHVNQLKLKKAELALKGFRGMQVLRSMLGGALTADVAAAFDGAEQVDEAVATYKNIFDEGGLLDQAVTAKANEIKKLKGNRHGKSSGCGPAE